MTLIWIFAGRAPTLFWHTSVIDVSAPGSHIKVINYEDSFPLLFYCFLFHFYFISISIFKCWFKANLVLLSTHKFCKNVFVLIWDNCTSFVLFYIIMLFLCISKIREMQCLSEMDSLVFQMQISFLSFPNQRSDGNSFMELPICISVYCVVV